MYTIDEIGKDFVVVNGKRIKVNPPFESIPNKRDYEAWLSEVMANVIEAIGSRAKVPALKNYFASVAQRGEAD